MKNNFNTLNEEINRIKSLFTEERLYGNLVVEKNIITEIGIPGKGAFKKLLTSLIGSPATTKNLKIPLEGGRYVSNIRVNKAGDIVGDTFEILPTSKTGKLLRKNVIIGLEDFIDPAILKRITTKVSNLSSLKTLDQYISKSIGTGGFLDDLGDMYKSLIKTFNLEEEIGLDEIDKILGKIQNSRVNEIVGQILSNKELIRNFDNPKELVDEIISIVGETVPNISKTDASKMVREFMDEITTVPGMDTKVNKLINAETGAKMTLFSGKKAAKSELFFNSLEGLKKVLADEENATILLKSVDEMFPGTWKRIATKIQQFVLKYIADNLNALPRYYYRTYLDLNYLARAGKTKLSDLTEPTRNFLKAKYGDNILNIKDSSGRLRIFDPKFRETVEVVDGWENKVRNQFLPWGKGFIKTGYKKEMLNKTDYYIKMGRKLGFFLYFVVAPFSTPMTYAKSIVELLRLINLEDSEEDIKDGIATKVAEEQPSCLNALRDKYKELNPDWEYELKDISFRNWKIKNIKEVAECVENYEEAYNYLSSLDSGQLIELAINSGGSSWLIEIMTGTRYDSEISEKKIVNQLLGKTAQDEVINQVNKNQ